MGTVLVQQRRQYDCVLACLAMATEKDYDTLWTKEFCDEVEAAQGTGRNNLHDRAYAVAGLQKGVSYSNAYCVGVKPSSVHELLWCRRALLQVPSLNYEGAMHYVYWDGERVLDPSRLSVYRWLDSTFPHWVTLLRG